MKIREVLTQDRGAVVSRIIGMRRNTVRVIGASCPVGVRFGEAVNSFTVEHAGEAPVLAVCVCAHEKKSGPKSRVPMPSFLLELDGDGLIGEEEFCPGVNVQVYSTYMTADIEGQRFTSGTHNYQREPGDRYVDADTLCKFLAGDMSTDDVRDAAEEAETLITTESLAVELGNRVKELEQLISEHQETHRADAERLSVAHERIEELEGHERGCEARIAQLDEELRFLRLTRTTHGTIANHLAGSRWWNPWRTLKAIRKVAKEFREELSKEEFRRVM